MSDAAWEERFYRRWTAPDGLTAFNVSLKQSDLLIAAERDVSKEAQSVLKAVRKDLEAYLVRDPDFGSALEPYEVGSRAPYVVRVMAGAALLCGVGPMAAVAGAVAEEVGRALLPCTDEVVVENGGDVFARLRRPLNFGLYSGEANPILRIELPSSPEGIGVASSSARIGPSLSLGDADVATVVASSAALADACATAFCNRIHSPRDLKQAVDWALGVDGVKGAVAVCGGETALGGEAIRLL